MAFTLFHGLNIGRLFNIQIYLDWSLTVFALLLLPAVLFVLQSFLLPAWDFFLTVIVGVGMLFLALVSLLFHQFAHVLVANLEEIPTHQLVLYPFGGSADTHHDAEASATNAKIALAGPLANAVLGSLALLALAALNGSTALAFEDLPLSDPLQFLLWWTAACNIFLALVNLFPAAPLDGGQILCAVLWQRGNTFEATQRWSSASGIFLGWVFILFGIAFALNSDVDLRIRLITVFGLLILGWSVKQLAAQLVPHKRVHPLQDVRIKDFPLSDVQTISPYLALQQLIDKRVYGTTNRVFAILQGDALDGMLWLEDIWNVPEEQWQRVLAKYIMTPRERLYALKPTDSAEHLPEIFAQRQNRPIPIMENGRFLGVLRRKDIDVWLCSRQQRARQMRTVEKAKKIIRFFSSPRNYL